MVFNTHTGLVDLNIPGFSEEQVPIILCIVDRLPLLNVYSPRAGYPRSLYNTRTVFSAGLLVDSSDGQDLHLFI